MAEKKLSFHNKRFYILDIDLIDNSLTSKYVHNNEHSGVLKPIVAQVRFICKAPPPQGRVQIYLFELAWYLLTGRGGGLRNSPLGKVKKIVPQKRV